MRKINEFSNSIIEELNYYVYLYSDPDTKIPFYIGKGKGNRCFNHLFEEADNAKRKKIKEIQARGKEPLIEILCYGMNEETAFKVEAAAIDLIGMPNLTNRQKGNHSTLVGRMDVNDLCKRLNKEEIQKRDFKENAMFIRVNHYHYGMSAFELYELTRRSWKVSLSQAQKVDYAFAIYQGLVLEVYQIAQWLPAHSTMNILPCSEERKKVDIGKYEFVGKIAEETVRKKYVGRSVASFYQKGERNPIKYIFSGR